MSEAIRGIVVYWDSRDPHREGWVYRFYADNGRRLLDYGWLDTDRDGIQGLLDAIAEAVQRAGLGVPPDDFEVVRPGESGQARWFKGWLPKPHPRRCGLGSHIETWPHYFYQYH